MIPVDQQQLSSPVNPYAGDCFRACVASILEVQVTDVPHFCKDYLAHWWEEFRTWLHTRDLDATYYVPADFPDTSCPLGWAIAGGTSPRFPNILHAVVARDGAVVHDPHPARAGLPDGIQDYIVIHGPEGAWTRYNGEQEPA